MAAEETKGTRASSIDGLRGLLLVMMGLNHIPAAVSVFTNHPLGYVSSAEGFVFLSGLMAAKVSASWSGWGSAVRAALRRTGRLHRAHCICAAAVCAWAWCLQHALDRTAPWPPPHFFARPFEALIASVLLVYRPGLLDILPMYCALMMLVPLLTQQLAAGRAHRVLAGSILGWLLTNVLDSQHAYVDGLIDTGAFNLGAWQLLFVTGFVCGHEWAHGRISRLRASYRDVPIVVALATLFLLRHEIVRPFEDPELLWQLSNKNNLAPLRLLNVALLFYGCKLVQDHWPRAFRWPWLEIIGRHGLPAFCAHVLVATMILGAPELFAQTAWGPWLGPALLLLAMFGAARHAAGRKARAPRPSMRDAVDALPAWPGARDQLTP